MDNMVARIAQEIWEYLNETYKLNIDIEDIESIVLAQLEE
jgi:hypothetical protein